MQQRLINPTDAADVQLWLAQWQAQQELARMEQEEDFYYGADAHDLYEDYDRYAFDYNYGTGAQRLN